MTTGQKGNPETPPRPKKGKSSHARALLDAYARCLWVLPCSVCRRLFRLRDIRTVDTSASTREAGARATSGGAVLVTVRRTTMNPYDAQVLVHMCRDCLKSIHGGRPVE